MTKKLKLELISTIEGLVEILKPIIKDVVKKQAGTEQAGELILKLTEIEMRLKELKK
jgi:hypothetical protein